MAIDTEDKRASACQFFLTMMLPVPDGTIGEPDRAQLCGLYCGISAGAPVVAVEADLWWLIAIMEENL